MTVCDKCGQALLRTATLRHENEQLREQLEGKQRYCSTCGMVGPELICRECYRRLRAEVERLRGIMQIASKRLGQASKNLHEAMGKKLSGERLEFIVDPIEEAGGRIDAALAEEETGGGNETNA